MRSYHSLTSSLMWSMEDPLLRSGFMMTSLAQLLMLWSFRSISWLRAETERGLGRCSLA